MFFRAARYWYCDVSIFVPRLNTSEPRVVSMCYHFLPTRGELQIKLYI